MNHTVAEMFVQQGFCPIFYAFRTASRDNPAGVEENVQYLLDVNYTKTTNIQSKSRIRVKSSV